MQLRVSMHKFGITSYSSLLHSDHLFIFSHLPKSLTHFAPGLYRIGRRSFWRWGVGSGSPATIRGMLVGDHLTGDPLATAGLQLAGLQSADFRPPTPCSFDAVPATLITRSSVEIHWYFMLRGYTLDGLAQCSWYFHCVYNFMIVPDIARSHA